jgi:hypothetical protein
MDARWRAQIGGAAECEGETKPANAKEIGKLVAGYKK